MSFACGLDALTRAARPLASESVGAEPVGAGPVAAMQLERAATETSALEAFVDALLLGGGYNTTVVLIGAALLGVAGGLVGAFTMLHRQSLVVDAFAHATLPGVALAFLVHSGIEGVAYERSLPVLLVGAGLAGVAAVGAIAFLTARTRLSTDTSTAAVSSASFGLGIVLLSIARRRSGADQAGLDGLIFGATASMTRADAVLMGALAAVSIALAVVLHRPLIAAAFNRRFARASGLPLRMIDGGLAALAAAVALAGLQAVGMLLVVAVLVIPPTAARLWTATTGRLLWLSAALGAVSAWIGAALSAALPNAPAGAIIVLVAAALFTASLLAAPRRGILAGWARRRALGRRLGASDPSGPEASRG
ncbi:MAG: metal ABC transporter permease [Planctomycetota bacterium]